VASGFTDIRQLQNVTKPDSARIRVPDRIWLSAV
jgi:hypothetical protein